MPRLSESVTAVIIRGERVCDGFASEPYEAGWAREAVFFLLGMDSGADGSVLVQISPDGMHWVNEGTKLPMPKGSEVTFSRLAQFGNWLRLEVRLPEGRERRLLATLHLKG